MLRKPGAAGGGHGAGLPGNPHPATGPDWHRPVPAYRGTGAPAPPRPGAPPATAPAALQAFPARPGVVGVEPGRLPAGQQGIPQPGPIHGMEHLAIQPVELVPVKAATGLVDPVKPKHGGGVRQAKALAQLHRWRPAQEAHVVGDGGSGVAEGLKIVNGGDPVPLRELATLLVQDERGVGEGGPGGRRGRCRAATVWLCWRCGLPPGSRG